MSRTIRVLGIESSCDDTGVAVIDQDGQVLSNCINSQLKQHLYNGGIIPGLARDFHLQNIDTVARQAIKESGLKTVAKDIDAITVSTRPGLQHSLQVGLDYARVLAKKYSKPLIPIHHMQAHALMPLMQNRAIRFPALALLISGGHCILSVAKKYNEFHILGCTKDDSPGDMLDKIARRFKLRNLGPPFDEISGGAALELLSRREGANKFKYFNLEGAIPMARHKGCHFSFTGYRGVIEFLAPEVDLLWSSGRHEELLDELSHIASSLQRAILIQLVRKLQRAYMFYRMHWRYQNEDAYKSDGNTKHIGFDIRDIGEESGEVDVLVSGGVAANTYLIDNIRASCQAIDPNIRVFVPQKKLCSDNGVMVAWNGMLRYLDFLSNKSVNSDRAHLDDDVICDAAKMDQIRVSPKSDMGIDISAQVEGLSFGLCKLPLEELRLKASDC